MTKRKGYMDYVDFMEELGNNPAGNKVFPSVKALKKRKPCADECGIIEVEITLVKVVQKGKPPLW